MEESLRGNPNVTNKSEFLNVMKLVRANHNDVFCDLGCGHGRLCVWAAKIVKFSYGVEDERKRYVVALKNVKRTGLRNIRILREDYSESKTLQKLKTCNIFYCTNDECWGFYKKFEEIMADGTSLISPYFPPYPIKPDLHQNWMYVITTPFKLAKNKREWINAVTDKKNTSMKTLYRKIYRTFTDYKQRVKDLDEEISGTDWLVRRMHKK